MGFMKALCIRVSKLLIPFLLSHEVKVDDHERTMLFANCSWSSFQAYEMKFYFIIFCFSREAFPMVKFIYLNFGGQINITLTLRI